MNQKNVKKSARVMVAGALLLLVSAPAEAAQAASDVRPNIIIFYVDDLGWQDVPLNDLDALCPYETPNLVKFAESGMSLSQAYASAPSCSPSRSGLLTGQHPAKIGITHVWLGQIKKERANARRAPYAGTPRQHPAERRTVPLGKGRCQTGRPRSPTLGGNG